jgi:hypothetical protein
MYKTVKKKKKKNLQKLSDQSPIIMKITTTSCHCNPESTFITGGSTACIYFTLQNQKCCALKSFAC